MKKTKIICTIGPACQNEKTLKKMCEAGMNVARINFSHGDDKSHAEAIELVKNVRQKTGSPLGIMLDTKGPEYRIKTFANGKIMLKKGDEFTFTTKEVVGTNKIVSVTYKKLASEITVGDIILLNNGLLSFKVKNVQGANVVTTVVCGGELSNNKSMNFPQKVLSGKYLSEQDKHDLLLGIEHGVDFVACSFVSCKKDVLDVRNFLNKNDGQNIEIIAKIENENGVNNLEQIIEASDGVMVARGDLGVEIAQEKLPHIQKTIIQKCLNSGKIVITATEMLESMITSPRPTRAETSDVANAVFDGSSAIMLSGETAMGKYPILAVETMSKIAIEAENCMQADPQTIVLNNKSNLDAICDSCCKLSKTANCKLIVACSKTGKTIKNVSKHRPMCHILGLVTNKDAFYKLSLYYGVYAQCVNDYKTLNVLFDNAKDMAKSMFKLHANDTIVITGGTSNMTDTNLIKLEKI